MGGMSDTTEYTAESSPQPIAALRWGSRTWTADELAALPDCAVLDWDGREWTSLDVILGRGTPPFVTNVVVSADRSTVTWVEV